jgi:hypothetical protein
MYRLLLVLLLVTTIFAANRTSAQDVRATIGGQVADAQGGVIPNAQVTVVSDDTGVKQNTVSNGEGLWRLGFLLPGHYHFTVSSPGFKTEIRNGIELQAADIKSFDVKLAIGAETQTVTVQAETPLVDTTAATYGTVITTNELEELPTQSHVVALFATISPGVQQRDQGSNVVRGWSNDGASQVVANGGRNDTFTNSFQLDGMPNTKNEGDMSFIPPMDSVQEFRVQTNAYDAAIGRQAGATVNMGTRAGGKSYHGVLYEYNQNNFLNARNWGDTSGNPGAVHYNQFGGTFGGPVRIPKIYDGRNRTFFFLSFDQEINTTPKPDVRSVPTDLERSGDFSQSWTTQSSSGSTQIPYKIYNPYSLLSNDGTNAVRNQFLNNKIPDTMISPVAKAILKFVPHAGTQSPSDALVSNTSNNYRGNGYFHEVVPIMVVRLDQHWSDEHHSFATFNWSQMDEQQVGSFNNLASGLYQGRTSTRVAVDHVWTMSPTRILDIRANVTRFYNPQHSYGAGYDPTQLGMPSSYAKALTNQSFPQIIGFAGDFGASDGGQLTADTNYTWGATLTKIINSHTLHAGAEYWIIQRAKSSVGPQAKFGFGSNWTQQKNNQSGTALGSAFASFLLGLANNDTSNSYEPVNASAFFSQHFYAGFIQDDWRVSSKLTLNFGIRYDLQTGVTERFNRLTDRYDPNAVNPIDATAQPAYASVLGSIPSATNSGALAALNQNRPASSFVSHGALLFAGVNGVPRSATDASGYWQPRVGFAYQVRPSTVIRGGFGRFAAASLNKGDQNGFSRTTNLDATEDNYITPHDTLDNPYRGGILQPTGSSLGALTNLGSGPTWDDPKLGRLNNWQASTQLQQQFKSWLFDLGFSYENTQSISVGWDQNLQSLQLWKQLQQPLFNADGSAVTNTTWNVQVPNPYYHLQGVSPGNSAYTNSTVAMNQLLRPIPYMGSVNKNLPSGQNHYYAMQTKLEKRLHNGVSFIGSFTWAKMFEDTAVIGPSIIGKVEHKLGGEDRPFNVALTGVWNIPFGRGKSFGGNMPRVLDSIVGGWEMSGKFNQLSGTPLVFSTDGFYSGQSMDLGSNRTLAKYFDTSQYVRFPSSSTDTTNYPAWTGLQNMPGGSYHSTGATKNATFNDFGSYIRNYATRWGSVRQQGMFQLDLGMYKNFQIHEATRFQLRFDAFNATNHPRFNGANTDPTSSNFGRVTPTTVGQARLIELGGKLYF